MTANKTARLTDEAAIYRGFSCPYEFLEAEFLEAIAVEYARGFTKRFVRLCDRNFGARNRKLVQFVDAGLENPLTFDTVWNDAFAQVRRAVLETNSPQLLPRAATLGLRLAESGQLGEWEVEFASPVRLQLDRWLLPGSKRVNVASTARDVTIQVAHRGSRRTAVFSRRLDRLQADDVVILPVVGCRNHVRCQILVGDVAKPFQLDGIRPVSSTGADASTNAVRKALHTLAKFAPIFLPWVGRVLRGLIPVQSVPGKICSGSYQDHPGTIYASVDCPPMALAEILVHEASHQYYFLLARYGALDTGSGEAFFSPIKGTKRPLSMILLAYHAFANVLLLYRLCRKNGIRDGDYCRENERQLMPQLRVLERALGSAKTLTPLGESLWRPLAARIG